VERWKCTWIFMKNMSKKKTLIKGVKEKYGKDRKEKE